MTPEQSPLRAPEPLTDDHLTDTFSSGAPTLDTWLKRKAGANQASGASRTYVLYRGQRVVGFYVLAAGSVSHNLAPRKLKQNMPNPVPVIVLGRLAMDASEQGNGLGRALLRDAVLRITAAAHEVGIEPPQLYRRVVCSTARRPYRVCSGLHRTPPLLLRAGCIR